MKQAEKYNPQKVEPKWQEEWKKKKTYTPDLKTAKNPFYNLMMFPYPSAEGLHVGNMYAFTGVDVFGRFQRMQGNSVFEPIGLDGFGIHSENYAIKIGKHPMDQAQVSQKNFYRQLTSIGNGYDFTRTLETYDPTYYKWTQWLFTELFKAGLAYRKKAPVNFCPSCKTVLADEQVVDGKCERCGSVVERRELEQWFFKITEYADALLANIPRLNWTKKVKIAQERWIGKSEGLEIDFKIKDSVDSITVYTVYPETIFGVTYMVLAPEHPLVQALTTKEHVTHVNEYILKTNKKSEFERANLEKNKTGVFTGSFVINPINGEEVPVWIADYVLAGYGTGAVMGVPGSDLRDFDFATQYKLPIKRVIGKTASDTSPVLSAEDVLEDGVLVNSGIFSGLKTPTDAREKIKDFLSKEGVGRRKSQYHLRDWLISRQRYWGPPIPMIFCQTCASKGKSWFDTKEAKKYQESNKNHDSMKGWYPVSQKDLPIQLPYVADYKPLGTGKAPLANYPDFYRTVCPECGNDAVRETDVSDTFLDSAWYFLRYVSSDLQSEAFDIDIVKKWLPVKMYIGGAEHSVLHLLYSRFITMVLKDLGHIPFDEPFSEFFAHGLIIKDGAKMSKSKGNVVVPDEYIKKYGADTLRLYLMFLGAFNQGGDFRDSGIEGMYRFVKRVYTLLTKDDSKDSMTQEQLRFMHKTIKKVTEDIGNLHYNTAIASLMEWYNFLSDQSGITREEKEVFLKLIAPFAPHLSEELWSDLGNEFSIHTKPWPTCDENYLVQETIIVAVQVNGKLRDTLEVNSLDIENKEKIEEHAKTQEKVANYLQDKSIRKVIYVPGKIINFVVS